MSAIQITQNKETLRISRKDGSYWDTSIKSGPGSFESWAAQNLFYLVDNFGLNNVADAIESLNIYPPKINDRDVLEIENWIEKY